MAKHDAFISYSRRDSAFAEVLEQRLEKYKPPKELGLPARYLDIFRDKKDFQGPDYPVSLDKHLRDSTAMIVLCSPDARASTYVNDEIRSFADANGTDRIVPVLVRGVPNNEARSGREADKAFPEALYDYFEMPLAVNYLEFDSRHDQVHKGAYFDSWSMLLANIFNLSRSEVEQRERRRRARTLQIAIASTASVIALLITALIVTLISRSEAIEQAIAARNETSTRLAVQALEKIQDTPEEALQLAIQAVETYRKFDDPPVSRAIEALHKARISFGGGRPAIPWREDQENLVHSPDLQWVATSSDSGVIRFTRSGSGVVEILTPPTNELDQGEAWVDTGQTELLFAGTHLIAARPTIREDDRSADESIIWFWRLDESGIASAPQVIARITDEPRRGIQLKASPDGQWLIWREGRDQLHLHALGSSKPPYSFESIDSRQSLVAFSNDSKEMILPVRDGLQKVLLQRPVMPPSFRPQPVATPERKTKNPMQIVVTGSRISAEDTQTKDPDTFKAVPAGLLAGAGSIGNSMVIATATRYGRKRDDGSRPQGFSRIATMSPNGHVVWWDLDRESTDSIDAGNIYSAYTGDIEIYGLEASEQNVTFEFDPSGQRILAAVAHQSGEFGIIAHINLAGPDGWKPLIMEQLQSQTTARSSRIRGNAFGARHGYKLINQKRLGGAKARWLTDMGALTLGLDGTLLFRDIERGNSGLVTTGVRDMSFTNSGDWLPIGMRNGQLKLFDIDEGEYYIDLSAHDLPIENVVQGGGWQSRILASDITGFSRVWELQNPVLNADEGDVGTFDWHWAYMDDLEANIGWDLTSPDPFSRKVELEVDISKVPYNFAISSDGAMAASLEPDEEDSSHITLNLWSLEGGRLSDSPIVSRHVQIDGRPKSWRWGYKGRLAKSGEEARFFFTGSNFSSKGAWLIDLNDADASPQPLIVPEQKVEIRSVSRDLDRLFLAYANRRNRGNERIEVLAIDKNPVESLVTIKGTAYGDLSPDGRWLRAHGRLIDFNRDYSKPRVEKENSEVWPYRIVFGDAKPPVFVDREQKLWGVDNTIGTESPLQLLIEEMNFTEVAWDDKSNWLALGDESGRVWILDGSRIIDFPTLLEALNTITPESSLPMPWLVDARDEISRFRLLPNEGWAVAITKADYYLFWRGAPGREWAKPLVFHVRELFTEDSDFECRADGQQCFIGGQFLTFDESQMLSMSKALLSGRPMRQ